MTFKNYYAEKNLQINVLTDKNTSKHTYLDLTLQMTSTISLLDPFKKINKKNKCKNFVWKIIIAKGM